MGLTLRFDDNALDDLKQIKSYYPYLVFYSVVNNEVVVLHVRHAARGPIDPASL